MCKIDPAARVKNGKTIFQNHSRVAKARKESIILILHRAILIGQNKLTEEEQKMDIKDSYRIWSSTYDIDKNRTRDLDRKVTRGLLANTSFQSILEIGCGTGKNTLFFSEIAEKVHALDFSEEMISKAKEKLSGRNVTFSIADLTKRWPCEGQSFELVSCNLVLEHIENLSFIFSEACRTLIKGGKFLVSELHPFRQYEGTKANFQGGDQHIEIEAFVYNISDFLNAATENHFTLEEMKEWWHEEDIDKPPRLVSFKFQK